MDIAALSMAMSQTQMQQSVGVALANKVMDLQETQAQQLIADIQAVPSFGHVLDVQA